jgi:hypothetical protein
MLNGIWETIVAAIGNELVNQVLALFTQLLTGLFS